MVRAAWRFGSGAMVDFDVRADPLRDRDLHRGREQPAGKNNPKPAAGDRRGAAVDQRTEAKRAKLTAYLQKTGRSNFHIVIRNDGESLARDVIIMLDGKPLLEHPVIPQGEQEVSKIGPHSEVKYIAAVHFGCAPPFDIAIQWHDEAGEGGKYETTLT
jgi:hypothetical protein